LVIHCCGLIDDERLQGNYRCNQAIEAAHQDSDKALNDGLFDHLCQKDDVSFWKSWHKRFCSNSLKPTNVLYGVSGAKNVWHEFHKFYSGVAQPNTVGADSRSRALVIC